ncbi:hypothetical protein Q1695_012652 [Nippostrongylus brasiliensis]|nr:hypothetical protein Q1695_012652 [Nippostrongylus brasiliensis]
MSKTLYNVITLVSLLSLLHCAYSAAQHRSYLRLTEQPFISLPPDVLAQTLISLVALIYGASHVAGAFQHIKSDPNRDRSWDEAGSCMSFITFEHRGKAMSPAHAVVRQRNEEANGFLLSRRLNPIHSAPHSNQLLCLSNNLSNAYHTQYRSCSSASPSPDFSKLPGARQPKIKPTSSKIKPTSAVLHITKEQAQRAFKHCLESVRSSDRDGYQAVLAMPKKVHAELFTLLAFNVEVATIREKITSQRGGESAGVYRLQFWKDALAAIYGESAAPVPRQPVAIALCAFAPMASKSLLDSLVAARQQTIGDRPFKTVTDLENYGVATTGALIRLQMNALSRTSSSTSCPEQAIKAADQLGIAHTVINLLRSFLPLLSKGVVLLPADLMTLHNLTPDRIYNKKDPGAMVLLVKDLVKVASLHLSASRDLAPFVPRALTPALAPTSCVVDHITRNIVKVNHDLYNSQVQGAVPLLLWKLLYKNMLGKY